MAGLRVLFVVSMLGLLPGCGGANRRDDEQVARIVRADVHASGGSCTAKGAAEVGKKTVTLYACTMRDVPAQYRQFGSFNDTVQHYCYAWKETTASTAAIASGRCAQSAAEGAVPTSREVEQARNQRSTTAESQT